VTKTVKQVNDFVQIALQSLGSCCSETLTFVNQSGKRISENTGDNREMHLLQTLFSAAMQYILVAVLRDTIYYHHLLRGSAKQSVKDGIWQHGNYNTSQLSNLSSYNDEILRV